MSAADETRRDIWRIPLVGREAAQYASIVQAARNMPSRPGLLSPAHAVTASTPPSLAHAAPRHRAAAVTRLSKEILRVLVTHVVAARSGHFRFGERLGLLLIHRSWLVAVRTALATDLLLMPVRRPQQWACLMNALCKNMAVCSALRSVTIDLKAVSKPKDRREMAKDLRLLASSSMTHLTIRGLNLETLCALEKEHSLRPMKIQSLHLHFGKWLCTPGAIDLAEGLLALLAQPSEWLQELSVGFAENFDGSWEYGKGGPQKPRLGPLQLPKVQRMTLSGLPNGLAIRLCSAAPRLSSLEIGGGVTTLHSLVHGVENVPQDGIWLWSAPPHPCVATLAQLRLTGRDSLSDAPWSSFAGLQQLAIDTAGLSQPQHDSLHTLPPTLKILELFDTAAPKTKESLLHLAEQTDVASLIASLDEPEWLLYLAHLRYVRARGVRYRQAKPEAMRLLETACRSRSVLYAESLMH